MVIFYCLDLVIIGKIRERNRAMSRHVGAIRISLILCLSVGLDLKKGVNDKPVIPCPENRFQQSVVQLVNHLIMGSSSTPC